MNDLLAGYWPVVVAALALTVAVVASAHAVLRKRDVRAAIGWVGMIWLVPFAGSALYGLLGINRIRRRASELKLQRPHPRLPESKTGPARLDLAAALPEGGRHLGAIGDLVDAMTALPLTAGNAITTPDRWRDRLREYDRGHRQSLANRRDDHLPLRQ